MNRCLKLKVRGKRLTRQFISHESRLSSSGIWCC